MAEAEVTGFTAERMLEIENTTVVDGNVVNDRLKLVTRNGAELDAGHVVGMTVIHHGTDANVARPTDAPVVYWLGTATPVNARTWDHLLRENI